jgi:hypothetical protein
MIASKHAVRRRYEALLPKSTNAMPLTLPPTADDSTRIMGLRLLHLVPRCGEPTSVVIAMQDDEHGFCVDRRKNRGWLGRQKAIGIAPLGGAPRAAR